MTSIHPTTAHITSWIPSNFSEVLYLSPLSKTPPEKAIRGGVPICWPNFAAADGLPFHGFARINQWQLIEDITQDKVNIKNFELPTETIESSWDDKAKLTFKVTSKEQKLEMTLTTTNLDEKPITITEALHTYIKVGDVRSVEITGQEGDEYYDKVADQNKVQKGPINFTKETDRIYQTSDSSTLIDPTLGRKLVISKSGASSTVIWNPWQDNAIEMTDFPDDDYLHMCCIEAANTHLNPVTIQPGKSHSLSQKIEIFKLS